MTTDLLVRQRLLISEGLQDATVVLVGLGMLGSWSAATLARTAKRVHGYDFDTVDDVNLGTQMYSVLDVGAPKAEALKGALQGLPFTSHPVPFTGKLHPKTEGIDEAPPLVVVSAADSFVARHLAAAWAAKYDARLFIDTRAHGNIGVVVAFDPTLNEVREQYIASLESDAAAAPAPACGAEGTAHVGMWVAQQVTSTINRRLSGLPYAYKTVFDVGFGEAITVIQAAPTPLEEVVLAEAQPV